MKEPLEIDILQLSRFTRRDLFAAVALHAALSGDDVTVSMAVDRAARAARLLCERLPAEVDETPEG